MLDATNPQNPGQIHTNALVKLDAAQGPFGEPHYVDPVITNPDGGPVPPTFLDNLSLPSNRLFGQGAQLRLKYFKVFKRS